MKVRDLHDELGSRILNTLAELHLLDIELSELTYRVSSDELFLKRGFGDKSLEKLNKVMGKHRVKSFKRCDEEHRFEVKQAFEEGCRAGRAEGLMKVHKAENQLEELKRRVKKFEDLEGVSIDIEYQKQPGLFGLFCEIETIHLREVINKKNTEIIKVLEKNVRAFNQLLEAAQQTSKDLEVITYDYE